MSEDWEPLLSRARPGRRSNETTTAGAVFYAALFGAIGAATGSLIRNQVVAIVGWLVWLTVVEHIAGAGFLPRSGG